MSRSILIIDDEVDQCLLLSRFLSRKNYVVQCAHTLSEGLKKLDVFHPDTLLLDNNLPDGLGWSEADKLHRLFPEMHITLVSANEASPYAITSDGFSFTKLQKPISLSTIESFL